jgi:5-formyltetrahydrofolate cyclo-ligase
VEAKRALRASMAALRDRLAAEQPDAAERAAAAFPVTTTPRVVAGTLPMRSELDPRPLMRRLEALGATLALPRAPKRGSPLSFHRWTAQTRFETSRFGVTEPVVETPLVEPDLVLVPLLAFDARGARLGYGGGFYDVTLAALRARSPGLRAIGVAFSGQRVTALPTEPHDQRLDAVLTEAGLTEFS